MSCRLLVVSVSNLRHEGRKILENPTAAAVDGKDTVFDAISKIVIDNTGDGIVFERENILKIMCGKIIITDLSSCVLDDLQSSPVCIFKNECVVTMKAKESNINARPVRNAFAIMVSAANTIEYFEYSEWLSLVSIGLDFRAPVGRIDEDVNQEELHNKAIDDLHCLNFNEQIDLLLRTLFKAIGLGFRELKEKQELSKFLQKFGVSLCFLDGHWKALLGVPFPRTPAKYSNSIVLKMLTLAQRKKAPVKSQRLTQQKVAFHQKSLMSMKIPEFKCSAVLKKARNVMMDDLEMFRAMFTNCLRILLTDTARHALSSSPNQPPNTRRGRGSDYDHTIVDPSTSNTSQSRMRCPIMKSGIKKLNEELGKSNNFEHILCSDVFFEIDEPTYDESRRFYRARFKSKILEGRLKHPAVIFAYHPGGNMPDFIILFKIPAKVFRTREPDNFAQNFNDAIDLCKKESPKHEMKQTVKNIHRILSTFAGRKVNDKIGTAIRNYLLYTEPNLDDEELRSLFNSGMRTELLLKDMRNLNSRGGLGDGATKFGVFFEKCSKILRTDAGADERRKTGRDDTLFGSSVTSIDDILAQTISALEGDVSDGKLLELPPIPSSETIRLQFVPNNSVVETAAKMTGRLRVCRHIQSRTLRKSHQDQHWVNACTRYHKEWLVDLKQMAGQATDSVKFVGQDDKAKVPIGDVFVPISTGVRNKQKAIVPADPKLNHNFAADHDWRNASLIPSVLLLGNIPNDYDGSFYSGGVEGEGEIHVTLRDATFDASDVFDHCATLYETLKNKYVCDDRENVLADHIEVLVLQTDGGPDHNITFLRTKLALISLFLSLGLDHFVAIRGAPFGSYLNVVERSMSLLNIGLQNLALVRGEMPEWAEKAVKGAGSMNAVRNVASDLEKKSKAMDRSMKEMQKRREKGSSSHAAKSSSTACISTGHESSNAGNTCSCSYSRVKGCQFEGNENMTLVNCVEKGCPNVLHHMCQISFGSANNLTEDGDVKVCVDHITQYYVKIPGAATESSNPDTPGDSRNDQQKKPSDSQVQDPKKPTGCSQNDPNRNLSYSQTDPKKPSNSQKTDPKKPSDDSQTETQKRPGDSQREMQKKQPSDSLQYFQSKCPNTNTREILMDLREEWAVSMDKPIKQLQQRFKYLKLSGRPVIVPKRCGPEIVEGFHKKLEQVCEKYDPTIREASRLKDMPGLQKFIENHVVATPYTFSIQKCGKSECVHCTPFRSKAGAHRTKVLQRQPSPVLDVSRPGHFYRRNDALETFGDKPESLVDLSDLPSKAPPTKKAVDAFKAAKKHDTKIGKTVSAWAVTSVRKLVQCEACGKLRCLFSKAMLTPAQLDALSSHIEKNQYVCGEALFPTSSEHILKEVVLHKLAIRCSDPVEKAYYNPGNGKRHSLVVPDICAHCCAKEELKDQEYLESVNKSEGYKCLPICDGCLDEGLKPVKAGSHARRNKVQEKKEKANTKHKERKKRKDAHDDNSETENKKKR